MRGTKPHLVVINGERVEFPSAPGWLSEHAKAEWARMQPYLEAKRYLDDIDIAHLENYCVAQGRVRECEAKLQTTTDLTEVSKLWRMQNQAMTTAKQLAAELGLTPMSRSRPTIQKDLFAPPGAGDGDGENPLDVT